jgi:hypothetical protein
VQVLLDKKPEDPVSILITYDNTIDPLHGSILARLARKGRGASYP